MISVYAISYYKISYFSKHGHMMKDIWKQESKIGKKKISHIKINNIPQIGNTPSVIPRAAEKDNCFGSAPLNKEKTQKLIN
jgi:hypothetical protein